MDKEALVIKFASEDWEFEEINRLNYETFVREIPQHDENEERALQDQFHDENEYLIAIQGQELLGMVAFRDKRPFSLDQKLPDLDSYLPKLDSICEIRLLAIKKKYRSTRIFWMMLKAWENHWDKKGYDLIVASAHSEQMALYKSIGLKSFGPKLGDEPVRFQPMYWTAESFRKSNAYKVIKRMKLPVSIKTFLPGPVNIPSAVLQEYSRAPEYHRTAEFIGVYEDLKSKLSELVSARSTQILMGSGTLGNDVVAAQLSLLDSHGLILRNGEFGNRLLDHAKRHGLKFDVINENWGGVFNGGQVEDAKSHCGASVDGGDEGSSGLRNKA